MSQLEQNTIALDHLIEKANLLPEAGDANVTPAAKPNDVQYIDYDGTILYSYSASDFCSLTTEPSFPKHESLVCQGWNWGFSQAQEHVIKHGKLHVGAAYTTDNGDTRIYIRLEDGRLSPHCGLAVNGTCIINWGDGSTDTVTGTSLTTVINTQHTYANSGDYVIRLSVTSGECALCGDTSIGSKVLWKTATTAGDNKCYQNAVTHVEIGDNVHIGANAFRCCYSLLSITMPNNTLTIGAQVFAYCYSLVSITLPDGIALIDAFMFFNCYGLLSVSVPFGIESLGDSSFMTCSSLSSFDIPDSVNRIGAQVFYNCYSLRSLNIPDSVTTIGTNVFRMCYSLSSLILPDSVTSVGAATCYDCNSLASVSISKNLASIPSMLFLNCYGLGRLHFKRSTPPNVGSSNTFSGVPTDCIICVPKGSLSAYTTATNYPDPATYTYIEE